MPLDVGFFDSSAGARIAYTAAGSGPPLVIVPPWTTHLQAQAGLSGYEPFHERLGRYHRVIVYDRWGTGLSERSRDDFSVQADVEVLRDIAKHLRLRRFSIVGPSHGAPVAVQYAVDAPEHVSHLVLYGSRASVLTSGETWDALRSLILANWPVAARSIAAVAAQGGDAADIAAFANLLVESASPETTVALQDAAIHEDLTEVVRQLRVPTLVLHRRADALVSCDDAVHLAGSIPGARLEIVDGETHVHYIGDAALLADRIVHFTAGLQGAPSALLSAREAQVLQLVAAGSTNSEVAEDLGLSVRTVERHLLNAYRKLGVRRRGEAVSLLRSGPNWAAT